MSKTLSTFILLVSSCLSFRAPNIGTTIFLESDLTKQCWDMDALFLLHSRLFLELLLPSPRVMQELDNEFAGDLINYFSLILSTMQSFPESRKKQLSLYAMEDVIGGYFHSIILPVARLSYYAGIISWKNMRKLNRYYDQLKSLLRTEGQGWALPRHQKWKKYEARLLVMHKPSCKKGDPPCSDLRIYKRMAPCDDSKICGRFMTVAVPIPFFDCKAKPYAVAVPFKIGPLFDLCSARSSYVIIRFFLQSNRCLSCRCKSKLCARLFKNNLYTWLVEEVVPRFNDDRTYVAFGGVIRLIRTLEDQGVSRVDLLHERDCYNRMAGVSEDQFVENTKHKLKVILIGLLVVLLLWFLLACCIICCRMTRKKCTCGRPSRRDSRRLIFPSEKFSNIMNKIKGEKGRRNDLWCDCDSKAYFSFTDECSRDKAFSFKSESSRKSSSPRTIFSSSSQSRSSRGDIQAYSAVGEPVSMTKGGSSSSESRGLPPIEEMSERSSIVDSKRPSVCRTSMAAISLTDSEKEGYSEKQELSKSHPDRVRRSHLVQNIQSGKLDNLQEDSRVHCYSDESDLVTEETESKTDISSDSIENLSAH